jgi:hypothetical protein
MYGLRGREFEERLSQAAGRRVVLFNFGVPGAGPVTTLVHLRRLLAAGVRPDLLFVEPLPFGLLGGLDQTDEAKLLGAERLALPELEPLRRYNFPVAELRRDWWESWPVPCYGHRFALLSRLAPTLLPGQFRLNGAWHTDDWGWQEPTAVQVDADFRAAAMENTRRVYGPVLARETLSGPGCRALRDTLELCRRERIPTVLLWMPETSVLRSLYNPTGLARLRAFLAEVSRDYATPLVDAREWMPDEQYLDGLHLLLGGALAFTDRLSREVVAPILAGRPHQPPADVVRREGEGG